MTTRADFVVLESVWFRWMGIGLKLDPTTGTTMGVLRNPREIHHAATEAVQPLDAAIDAIQKKMHRIW